jgi:hypothetical protein
MYLLFFYVYIFIWLYCSIMGVLIDNKRIEYNGQKDDNLQNTTQKTQYWASRTPLKPWVNSGAPEGYQFLLH